MKRRKRTSWWFRFWCACAVAAVAMGAVTFMVLQMERRALHAQHDANRQGLLRLALWRMDSWLSPRLGREAARPYYEYRSYYANRDVYTKYYGRIETGDVMSPSPLLTFQSEYFPLHFQIDASGAITSPQVPTGNALDLASFQLDLSVEQIAARQGQLDHVATCLAPVDLAVACGDGLALATAGIDPPPDVWSLEPEMFSKGAKFEDESVQTAVNWQDRSRRGATSNELQQEAILQNRSQQQLAAPMPSQQQGVEISHLQTDEGDQQSAANGVDVGPLVPLWIDGPTAATAGNAADEPALFFVRQVTLGDEQVYQGVAVDWPALQRAMISQASDLLPDVSIEPQPVTEIDAAQSVWMLATIPAMLRSSATLPFDPPVVTPTRVTLLLAWLGLLGGCVAVGMTLRSTIDYAQRRDQFASAVTHELRTPMTTFRMYSEMLADGMVEDDAQRDAYHQTLRDESIRFSAMIENMLSYARVEDGRMPVRAESTTPSDLASRLLPLLERRANRDLVELQIRAADDEHCNVDVEVIEQIIYNLVDNACKYGCAGEAKRVHVNIACSGDELVIHVADDGPGVSAAMRERIFEPFDRGEVEPGVETPGVGIGLALARGLARSMGGTLRIEPAAECDLAGLCVVLRVPRAA